MRENETGGLDRLVQTRTRRMQAFALAVVSGLFAGLGLFVATNILVVRGLIGGPATFAEALYAGHEDVGPNLGLLGQFFPGYRVTFAGSVLGFVYAFIVAWVVLYFGARVYNAVAEWRGGKR